MKSREKVSAMRSASVMAYFEEQSALIRSGGYWNCLNAARELSALFRAAGRSPWIARLRKTEARGEQVFHAPLTPRVPGVAATWTTHYVCCCDDIAYDPVAGRAVPLETYSLEVFGEQIATEVFVPEGDSPAEALPSRSPRVSKGS